jgi:hypothetical protein
MARRGDINGTKVGRQWRFSDESIQNMKKASDKKTHY